MTAAAMSAMNASDTTIVPQSDCVPLSAVEKPADTTSPMVEGYTAPENGSHDGQLIKPVSSVLKTADSASPPVLAPEAERKIADMIDEKKISQHMPKHSKSRSVADREKTKQKNQFYGEAFAYREPFTSARERFTRETILQAELKTNVIVKDEYTLITDLSYSLSSRYQRPEAAILVGLTHSACLLFGGTFDPAYILTITALPSHLQPATNKRNAALLQALLTDLLGVPPDRGVLKFCPILEENLATNGLTVRSGIEAAERATGVSNGFSSENEYINKVGSMVRSNTGRSIRRGLKSPPLPPVPKDKLLGKRDAWAKSSEALPLPPLPAPMTKEKPQRMGRRKSLLSLFSR
ncbi:MAG: hypothetical protein M1814_004647 [Vezdaea aestivalis]|nr:MAG: hypothetical protein M1814_004647 [Vezdaea aestivalis]